MDSEREVMAMEQANAEGTLSGAAIKDPNLILAFMFGEKLNHASPAFTFRAVKTGTRYTYRVNAGDLTDEQKAKGWKPLYFVKLLTGSDNENDYTYMGYVMFKGGSTPEFRLGKSSKYNAESQPVKAFTWALSILVQGRMPQGLEIWHEGRCGRCNRTLTTPESIEAGFGPDCLELMGGAAAIASFAKSFAPAAPKTNLLVPNDAMKAAQAAQFPAGNRPVMSTFTPKPVVPNTPKAILAAVNEDAEIAKLADQMWAVNPNNPKNIAPKPVAEPLPVDIKVAEALAKSQDGWTVEDAVEALSKRRIVNMNLKPSTKVQDKAAALGVAVEPIKNNPAEFAAVQAVIAPADGVAETWKQIHEDLANWPKTTPEYVGEQDQEPAQEVPQGGDLDSIEGF